MKPPVQLQQLQHNELYERKLNKIYDWSQSFLGIITGDQEIKKNYLSRFLQNTYIHIVTQFLAKFLAKFKKSVGLHTFASRCFFLSRKNLHHKKSILHYGRRV
jgi:hypothetical protein